MTHTHNDADTESIRRTRADLRLLADVVKGAGRVELPDDMTKDTVHRMLRLNEHGWVTGDPPKATADGHQLAGVVATLEDRDTFDMQVDLMGMSDFVDAATSAPSAQDALDFMAGTRTVANLIDEARHQTDTQDEEFDHDGLFAPHFADFDARNGKVELRFETKAAATAFFRHWCPERYDVERKHDDRFASNRNPRRLVVTVSRY